MNQDKTPAAEAAGRLKRKILLFSDGTGNSSGKLFKTNVWRLYEAVDFQPVADSGFEQIAYYSNGVGTSNFRPLAMLAGIFGLGLKANILDLYKYLCRNWRPGDEIYLFGFSRGAFTIRLLVGLIASQGIIRGARPDLPPDEDYLSYFARAAYRRFSGEAWPNRRLARGIARCTRAARNALLELHRRFTGRRRYDPRKNQLSDISFVGVWDTVAAYGGPIVELTRGIDDWIWPLTMPNYQLSPCVAKARHALSLDDERDAFQPLLWDEVREEMLVRWGGPCRENGPNGPVERFRSVSDARLKQVWFAGMHADVGGGYPDESLSYVSLAWMIDEIGEAVTLLPEHVGRIARMANPFGPIHNSRSGLAGYYRFQPRRIDATVDWFDYAITDDQKAAGALMRRATPLALGRSTRSLRDPEIADKRFEAPPCPEADRDRCAQLAQHIRRDHGLLRSVRVHESVLSRIVSGTDNYAPVSLPHKYDVVFASRTGLSQRLLDVLTAKQLHDEQNLASPKADRQRARTWDMVFWRRLQYFTTAAVSILLATMPLWDRFLVTHNFPEICGDGRCVVRPLLELAGPVTMGYAQPWIASFSQHALAAFLLLAGVLLLFAYGSAYDLRLRGHARRAWRMTLGLESDRRGAPKMPRSIVWLREHVAYQRLVTDLKWYIAPFFAGWTLIVGTCFVAVALVCQLFVFPILERQSLFCTDDARHPLIVEKRSAHMVMNIADPCSSTGRSVAANEVYHVRVTMLRDPRQKRSNDHRWLDGGTAAINPEPGNGANISWWADLLGVPFRRVPLTGWLQPLTAVHEPKDNDGLLRRLLGQPIKINSLSLACDSSSGGYVGEFRPTMTGTLSFAVNDAVMPGRPNHFYRNNLGIAAVQIWKGEAAPGGLKDWPAARCTPTPG